MQLAPGELVTPGAAAAESDAVRDAVEVVGSAVDVIHDPMLSQHELRRGPPRRKSAAVLDSGASETGVRVCCLTYGRVLVGHNCDPLNESEEEWFGEAGHEGEEGGRGP